MALYQLGVCNSPIKTRWMITLQAQAVVNACHVFEAVTNMISLYNSNINIDVVHTAVEIDRYIFDINPGQVSE